MRLVFRTEYRNSLFLGEGGGHLLKILSLGRGVNSSIYGNYSKH